MSLLVTAPRSLWHRRFYLIRNNNRLLVHVDRAGSQEDGGEVVALVLCTQDAEINQAAFASKVFSSPLTLRKQATLGVR